MTGLHLFIRYVYGVDWYHAHDRICEVIKMLCLTIILRAHLSVVCPSATQIACNTHQRSTHITLRTSSECFIHDAIESRNNSIACRWKDTKQIRVHRKEVGQKIDGDGTSSFDLMAVPFKRIFHDSHDVHKLKLA